MLAEISLQLALMRSLEPRQRYMRRVAPLFRRISQPAESALDLFMQMLKHRIPLDPDPQHAQTEMADRGQAHIEARCADRHERRVDVGRLALVDFANKAQGQVIIAGID